MMSTAVALIAATFMCRVQGLGLDIGPKSNNSAHRRLQRNVMGGRLCSTSITLLSDGQACDYQGSVLGTYVMTSEMHRKWTTWKMKSEKFLYRSPLGNNTI